jgi:hypothetical protein
MIDPTQIKKWKAAHPGIEVTDEALATVSPFPSLFAGDLAVYLEAKGQAEEVVQLVRDLNREIIWAYGNWEKAQRDGNAEKLLVDILNSAKAGGAEYGFVVKFLRDYAAANNIKVGPMVDKAKPAWLDGLAEISTSTPPLHPAYGQATPVVDAEQKPPQPT